MNITLHGYEYPQAWEEVILGENNAMSSQELADLMEGNRRTIQNQFTAYFTQPRPIDTLKRQAFEKENGVTIRRKQSTYSTSRGVSPTLYWAEPITTEGKQ